MDRRKSSILPIAVALAGSVSLAACSGPSGSGSTSLVTGSVFSSAPKAAVNPDNPALRPTKVALVSAGAVKCGFYFDPAKLRQAFLASHTSNSGLPADQIGKAQQSYDTAFERGAKALGPQEGFCTDGQVGQLKADLNRHLAGDYTTVAHLDKGPKQPSTWDWLVDGGQKADAGKMDANQIFFPSGGAQSTTAR
jgi:hypothetical protein